MWLIAERVSVVRMLTLFLKKLILIGHFKEISNFWVYSFKISSLLLI